LDKVAEATQAGVDYVQIREKDLSARELETIAREAVKIVRNCLFDPARQDRKTIVLINSRTDMALACDAGGVQLRANDIVASEVRRICESSKEGCRLTIGVSCHSLEEVREAQQQRADFVMFAPIFEKGSAQPLGLESLRRACEYAIPVFALGGVTLENSASCFEAGAAGIAGIRLFQENTIADVVRELRRR
jgi:thiamine-phosphate pyrophosphorylase